MNVNVLVLTFVLRNFCVDGYTRIKYCKTQAEGASEMSVTMRLRGRQVIANSKLYTSNTEELERKSL
jgi:hypothetical protein